jgi:putative OPT family oligopeptide transporter
MNKASADKSAGPLEEHPLRIDGFEGTPAEIENQWFEQVYRGRGDSMPQLTLRAVVMGMLLGGVLSLTNLYVGLKAGWGLGVAITACILSFAIWNGLYRLGIARTRMSILENNCMQSAASAAGYSTGSTLVSAFPAYLMLGNPGLSIPLMMAWVFFIAVLGVTMAIPMKRQMINVEQLRFPSGIAAAETLNALHSKGETGVRQARALGIAGILAAVNAFWADGLGLIHKTLEPWSITALVSKLNEAVLGKAWMVRTVQFAWDPVFIAAGVLTGMRASVSMMIGATLCWAVFVPVLQNQGIITGTTYKDIVQWTLWGGVSCMVTSGLLSFALQWRTVLRALGKVTGMFSKNQKGLESGVADIETPMSWFVIGQGVSLVALAWLGHVTFNMPVWQSTLAVALTFILALVACRVTGETDNTPLGPMGKVTQLVFGVVSPGNMNVNLMSANITAGSAGAAADLLTDLKSGYLLGANPRKQFLAQFSGIFLGTVVTVLCFKLMVGDDASRLGTDQFPAPAAQTWRAVAVALSKGLAALEPVKVWSLIIGGLIGIVLPLLERAFPKHVKYVPSAAGFGLAWTFSWYYSYLFFIGALLGWVLERKSPKVAKEYTFPVASGVIAGGSLMGVLLVFAERLIALGPQMWQRLFGS